MPWVLLIIHSWKCCQIWCVTLMWLDTIMTQCVSGDQGWPYWRLEKVSLRVVLEKGPVILNPGSQTGQRVTFRFAYQVFFLANFKFKFKLKSNPYPCITSRLRKRLCQTRAQAAWMTSLQRLNLMELAPPRNLTTTWIHLVHQHRYPYHWRHHSHPGVRSSQSS